MGLLYMGVMSAAACFFSLGDLIAVLIVIQTLFQFVAQCIAVILLRKRTAQAPDQFRMPFFPLPALIAMAGWLYIAATSKPVHIVIGISMLLAGASIYLVRARRHGEWPFAQPRIPEPA